MQQDPANTENPIILRVLCWVVANHMRDPQATGRIVSHLNSLPRGAVQLWGALFLPLPTGPEVQNRNSATDINNFKQ